MKSPRRCAPMGGSLAPVRVATFSGLRMLIPHGVGEEFSVCNWGAGV